MSATTDPAGPAAIDLAAVLAQAPALYLVLSPTYVVVGATDRYLQATHRTREALVGRYLFDAFPDNPADPSATGVGNLRASLDTVRRTRAPHRMPHQRYDVLGADGTTYEERHWSVADWPVLGPDGQVQLLIHEVEDITDRVRDEAEREHLQDELAVIREKLELALDSGGMGTWHIDLRTSEATTSRGTAAILGRPDTTGNVFELLDQLVHPEDLVEVNRVWQESVATRRPYAHDYRIVRPDGSVRWIFSRGRTKVAPDGTAVSFSGIVGDITERKEAEAALAAERRKLEAIFRQSPAAMALWRGPDLVFELVNPVFQGIVPERVLQGRPLRQALPELEDQPFLELIRHVLETGETHRGREVLAKLRARPDGPLEEHYFDFSYVRIEEADGRPYGVYAHAIDVTARVIAQRAVVEGTARLAASVDHLERERELREHVVAAISHDLRAPLTAAGTYAQLLVRKAAAPDLQRLAHGILGSLDRARRMIRDLLDANLVKAGKVVTIEVAPCDLAAVVRTALDEIAALHGPRFVLDAPPSVEGWCDPSAVLRIVQNLADNAVKYGAPTAPVTVILASTADAVELVVHNAGEPIPPDEQEHLFEPFRRAASAERSGKKGWGLGLTLVRGLAEAHGGSVAVRSAAGEGTTITVRLLRDARATVG